MTEAAPATLDLLIALCVVVVLMIWLGRKLIRERCTETTEYNHPLLPATAGLKQLAYLWWLVIGLWPQRRVKTSKAESPLIYRFSRIAAWWFLFLLLVSVLMVLWALLDSLM
jgi:type VI protein secretion system component VasF